MDCLKCSESLKTDEALKCASCSNSYHFVCIGLNEAEFRKILPMNKIKWKCPTCKLNKKCITNSSSPLSSTSSVLDNVEHSNQPQSILNLDAKNILHHIDERFNTLQDSIDSFKSEITTQLTNLSLTVSNWETKISSVELSLDKVSGRVDNLESENMALKSDLHDLNLKYTDLLRHHNKSEQWVRRSNVQINGVPQRSGENLFNVVKKLANKCGFAMNADTDIDFITRIAVKNDTEGKKPKPIIVKFMSRYKKDDFLSAVRKTKNITPGDIGYSGSGCKEFIYINDHLSPYNKALLLKVKALVKQKKYSYCWVKNCTIMVRRADNSPVLHITSDECLKKIS